MRFSSGRVGLNVFQAGQAVHHLRCVIGSSDCRGMVMIMVVRVIMVMCMIMAFAGASHVNIDKSAQAIVLAEVAARVFVAGGTVADILHLLQTDERGLLAVV